MDKTQLVKYDHLAGFDLFVPLPAGALEDIVGGRFDGMCNSDLACGNTTDIQCVNTACHANLNDVGCVKNAGCINP